MNRGLAAKNEVLQGAETRAVDDCRERLKVEIEAARREGYEKRDAEIMATFEDGRVNAITAKWVRVAEREQMEALRRWIPSEGEALYMNGAAESFMMWLIYEGLAAFEAREGKL